MSRLTAHTDRSVRVVRAPAKVNLFLEVRGRRPDGYHELETLMVAVDLQDTLTIRPADPGGWRLTCDDPSLDCGPDNLVSRAAERLRREAGRPLGAEVHLEKRIPTAAGLGGGSSDAAAALVGLNAVWQLELSPGRLGELAAELGSDVAFFLEGKSGWCTGRGEVITPWPVRGPLHFVLACPPFGCPTAEVYRRLRLPDRPRPGDAIRAAVRSGDSAAVGRELFNRLEEPAAELRPELTALGDRLRELDPLGVLLSGSGSTVFALARDEADAGRIARRLISDGTPEDIRPRIFVVRSVA